MSSVLEVEPERAAVAPPGGRASGWVWLDECAARAACDARTFDERAVAACRHVAAAVVPGGVAELVDVELRGRVAPGRAAAVEARVLRVGPTLVLATADLLAAGGGRLSTALVTFRRW